MATISNLPGKLTPLKIEAFSKDSFKDDEKLGEFLTSMTPERYTYQYKIVVNKEQAPGNTPSTQPFDSLAPEELELDILFDRTGVLLDFPPLADGVIGDLKAFKKIAINFDGKSHQMNFVRITWGTLIFQGRLSELNVEFKLFKPDGAPLRAMAKAKFTSSTDEELRVAKEDKKSPDLTHKRIVKDGDTLPLMTYQIYGDSKYYLHVAKVNGLANFRKLTPGQQIWFPPIEKRS